jgi:hypothetical protein
VQWLIDKLGGLVDWIREWGGRLWGIFKSVWDMVVNVWHTVMDPLFEVIRVAWDTVSAYLSAVWNGISAVAGAVWDVIKTVIWTPIETVWNLITSAWDTISGVLAGIWNGIKDTASSIWNAITDAIKIPVNLAIDAINILIKGANLAASAVNLIPGVDIPKIPEIPHVHTGGLIPGLGEQAAIVLGGEMVMNRNAVAANREALYDMNAGRSVSGSTTLDLRGANINLPGVTNGEDFLDEMVRGAERRGLILQGA